jgi:sigma-B regulation protein RsbU (phosphoserine phosphatase)
MSYIIYYRNVVINLKYEIQKSVIKNISYEEIINNNELDYKVVLDGILAGITDIIGVYKPNGEILFYNQAGYKFLNTTPEETVGKKCYDMLGRKCRCDHCTTLMAIETKKIAHIEKYIPEFDKFMDYRCNPVLDNQGEVILVIEQLRDVTEKKKMEEAQRESEERYRRIVELSPDGIVVVVDGKIEFANNEASKMSGLSKAELIGRDVKDIVITEYYKLLNERTMQVLSQKLVKSTYEYKLNILNNKVLDVQISSSFFTYNGKPALQCVIRDVTEFKKEINNAANIQRQSLRKAFPIPEKAFMERIYVPAKTVSGDYYSMNKLDEDTVIGLLFDVSGKGITAALNVSAFNVLFNEAINLSHKPMEIINYLNEKTSLYLGESYVAACCFSLDFKNKLATIVGAGINRFMLTSQSRNFEEIIIRGPFVGMFKSNDFEEFTTNFNTDDKLYFFTDGFDDLFDNEQFIHDVQEINNISIFKKYIRNSFVDNPTKNAFFKDDCTLLAIQIK